MKKEVLIASKSRKPKSENDPTKIWATNLPEAHIEISNFELLIQLKPCQEKLRYKIDGKRLWEQLKTREKRTLIPVGDLDMRFEEWEGEMVAVIEPPEESQVDFEFQVKVPLRELENTLCTYLKFC